MQSYTKYIFSMLALMPYQIFPLEHITQDQRAIQIAGLENEIRKAKNEIANKERERNALKKQLGEAVKEDSNKRDELENAPKTAGFLKQEKMEKEFVKANCVSTGLALRIGGLDDEIASLTRTIERFDSTIASLRALGDCSRFGRDTPQVGSADLDVQNPPTRTSREPQIRKREELPKPEINLTQGPEEQPLPISSPKKKPKYHMTPVINNTNDPDKARQNDRYSKICAAIASVGTASCIALAIDMYIKRRPQTRGILQKSRWKVAMLGLSAVAAVFGASGYLHTKYNNRP